MPIPQPTSAEHRTPIVVSVGPVGERAALAADWQDLEARADTTFFHSWPWVDCWLSTIDNQPQLLTARQGDTVVGLALLVATTRRFGWFSSTELFMNETGDPAKDIVTIEYNGILADRDVAAEVTHACLRAFNDDASPVRQAVRWDELCIRGVPASYRDLAQDLGYRVRLLAHDPSGAVDLVAVRRSGKPYLSHLSANTRYQIRRAMRLYEARGPLQLSCARTVDEALSFLDDLSVLHQRYWTGRGEPGAFAYPFFVRFHRALIARCLPDGAVEVVRISAGNTPVGYLYNFIYRGRVYYYLSGFAYESDPKLKPGMVSHYLCIDRHLARGADIYDFMAGENRYKTSLGSPGADMLAIVLERPGLKVRAKDLLRALKAAATKRASRR